MLRVKVATKTHHRRLLYGHSILKSKSDGNGLLGFWLYMKQDFSALKKRQGSKFNGMFGNVESEKNAMHAENALI